MRSLNRIIPTGEVKSGSSNMSYEGRGAEVSSIVICDKDRQLKNKKIKSQRDNTMKKALMLFTVMISTVLFNTVVFAAAWNVPTNVRVVQKSNTDTTGRIYGNIQSAINSITNASATNPYVVKVMPGTYDLGTAALQMKEYVTLEGSGAESTVITSAVADPGNCSVATIIMTNNSALKNLTVINNISTNSYPDVQAVSINNAKATLEGIKAYVAGSNPGHNKGVCVSGPSGQVTLDRSYIEVSNDGNQSSPVHAGQGATVILNNSKLLGIGMTNAVDVINCSFELTGTPGTAIVSNSHIEGRAPYVYGVNGESCNLTITNSTIIGTSGINSINVGQDSNGTPYSVKVANTLIQGGRAAIVGNAPVAKLVNNYDENFNSVANQP